MKVEVKPEYRDELQILCGDYNAGVDARDITEVELAVNGMVTHLFSSDEDLRLQSQAILREIADLQPGFLKRSVPILLKRYKAADPARSEMAADALERIFLGTKGEDLITDATVKRQLLESAEQRKLREEQRVTKDKALLIKKEKVSVDLTALSPRIFRIGDYYNKSLLGDDVASAHETVKRLVNTIYAEYPTDFIPATTLLKRMADPRVRQSFFVEAGFNPILEGYFSKDDQQRGISLNILETILDSVEDLLDAEVVDTVRASAAQREEQRKREMQARAERRKMLEKITVEPSFKWEQAVREIATEYNEAVREDNAKGLKSVLSDLSKVFKSKDDKERLDGAKLLRQFLLKNTEFVRELVTELVADSSKPEISEVLGEMLEELKQLELVDQEVYARLFEEHMMREQEKEQLRLEQQKKFEEIERVSIKFSADWESKLVKMCEKFNQAQIEKKEKNVAKVIKDLDKYMYAEDHDVRVQAATIWKRISDKYPELIPETIERLVELFDSEHEAREIASEALGIIIESKNRDKIFIDVSDEIQERILEEKAERKKAHEDQMLRDKWDAIKLDVTTIKINTDHKKSIQQTCRRYNEAIKEKDMDTVLEQVKEIVDIVLNEKKDEILNQGIEVLGKIALHNIELIAPTIDILLKWVDEEDKDKKSRAIKGLGEVSVARPGWSYMAIDKLVKVILNDADPAARMKAFLEISRVARKNATMLIEYGSAFIQCLKDDNKQIRRLAAWTLGSMAEVIPNELKEAIPALSDALHDEYLLVRKFADKALSLIRKAMRQG